MAAVPLYVILDTHWFVPILAPAGGGAYSSAALRQMATNIYFPKTDGVTFEQANATQIFGKRFKCGFDDVHIKQFLSTI